MPPDSSEISNDTISLLSVLCENLIRSLPRKDARIEKKDGSVVLHTKPVTGFSLKVNCCRIALNASFQSPLAEGVIIYNRFHLRINHAETAQLEKRNK